MTRLTTGLRQTIKNDLLVHRFEKEEKALKREKEKLGLRVYNTIFTPAERRKMSTLPDGWLLEADYFYVALNGISVCMSLAEKQRFPNYSRNRITVNNQALRDRHDELHAAQETLKESKRKASAEISALLHSVNTVNQLVAAWPEVKPFIKRVVKEAPALPSVKVEEVNAFLGLKAA